VGKRERTAGSPIWRSTLWADRIEQKRDSSAAKSAHSKGRKLDNSRNRQSCSMKSLTWLAGWLACWPAAATNSALSVGGRFQVGARFVPVKLFSPFNCGQPIQLAT